MDNIYREFIEVTPDLDVALRRVFINHLLVYNECLSTAYHDQEITFYKLKKKVTTYLTDKNISPIIEPALLNEIYYQHKKYKSNIRISKRVTDIQYITLLLKSYTNNVFTLTDSVIKFNDLPGEISLPIPLPDISTYTAVYFNLSYGSPDLKYRISMYAS